MGAIFGTERARGGGGGGGGGDVTPSAAEMYIDAWNRRDVRDSLDVFSEDCSYDDTTYYSPFVGASSLRRHLSLEYDSLPPTLIRSVDGVSVDGDGSSACVLWHLEEEEEGDDDVGGGGGRRRRAVKDGRGCTFFAMDDAGLIRSVLDVPEPSSPKPGDAGLNVLRGASRILEATGVGYSESARGGDVAGAEGGEGTTAVERYFGAWNRRDMSGASSCFAEDCEYDDAQYSEPFTGRDALERHLNRVADCLPRSFVFVADDKAVSADGRRVGVRWHLENGSGDALPFARGCSFYELDEGGLIRTGVDFPEPAVLKTGAVRLMAGSAVRKVKDEPARAVPLALWAAYMYVVFFSDGILPGANALALERRTWEEVRDLSINFFLVSPLLKLPFSPVVHPMLEGVFNLLLSWAAMFAGFLSDDRDDKPNIFPALPAVAGMQFLTSAFYLPYIGLRTSERLDAGEAVYREDLGDAGRTLGEWRGLGPLLGGVGATSVVWSIIGRPEFGPFRERYASFVDLLSIDRVGSSFVVDLVIFGLFQGWLVDDDMRRRGVDFDGGDMSVLRGAAKFVPFFGLALYLTLRPSLPYKSDP